jgi:hypothetical protein
VFRDFGGTSLRAVKRAVFCRRSAVEDQTVFQRSRTGADCEVLGRPCAANSFMPEITITRCDKLRHERHELLALVAEELIRGPRRVYLIKLLYARLKKISEEMDSANCPREPDEGQYLDIIRELDEI